MIGKFKQIRKQIEQPMPDNIEPILQEHHFDTKPCNVCASEKPVCLFATIPGCRHQFCQNCIVDWVEASFQKQMLLDKVQLTCPMSCGQHLTYRDLTSIISQQELRDRIESQYMRKYIHDSPDIVSCPNRHCTYAGTIIKKPCNQQLTCRNCGTRWKDPSQYTCWDKTRNLLSKRPTIRNSEAWSNLSKVLFTVACPRCGVYIQKNGGCSHMQCSKCNHQFCWFCHGDHYNYQHNIGATCGVRNIKLFAMYLALFVLCFLRVSQWFPFILSWPMSIFYWVSVVIATGLACWFGVGLPVIGFFALIKEGCKNPRLFCPLVGGTAIYLPLAHLFWNNFCQFQFGKDMYSIFVRGVVVLLVIGGCSILGFICKRCCRR